MIDTNTIASSVLLRGSLPAQAVRAAIRECHLLRSDATWAELEDVLIRAKFDRYQPSEVRAEHLASLEALIDRVSISSKIEACRHPKDDKFLELAVDGRADFILTGDKDLLVLHPFREIEILTPAQFLLRISG